MEVASVPHATCLVECCNRLSPNRLAAACGHCPVGCSWPCGLNDMLDHLTAEILFSNDTIGQVAVIGGSNDIAPSGRTSFHSEVLEHIAVAVGPDPGNDYADLVIVRVVGIA